MSIVQIVNADTGETVSCGGVETTNELADLNLQDGETYRMELIDGKFTYVKDEAVSASAGRLIMSTGSDGGYWHRLSYVEDVAQYDVIDGVVYGSTLQNGAYDPPDYWNGYINGKRNIEDDNLVHRHFNHVDSVPPNRVHDYFEGLPAGDYRWHLSIHDNKINTDPASLIGETVVVEVGIAVIQADDINAVDGEARYTNPEVMGSVATTTSWVVNEPNDAGDGIAGTNTWVIDFTLEEGKKFALAPFNVRANGQDVTYGLITLRHATLFDMNG